MRSLIASLLYTNFIREESENISKYAFCNVIIYEDYTIYTNLVLLMNETNRCTVNFQFLLMAQ